MFRNLGRRPPGLRPTGLSACIAQAGLAPGATTVPRAHARAGGFALVAVLMIIVVCSALFAPLYHGSTVNLLSADNHRDAYQAQLAAESGLSFMLHTLRTVRLPGNTTESNFAVNMAAALADALEGTENLNGQIVTIGNGAAEVPVIFLDDGRSFTSRLTHIGPDRCRMTVTGRGSPPPSVTVESPIAGAPTRRVSMDLQLVRTLPLAFEYGMACRGPVNLSGSTTVVGVNSPTEANVFSGSHSVTDPIHVSGSSVTLSGDLYVAQADGAIVIEGSPTIGGTQDADEIADHLHFDVDTPDFPVLDTTELEALATSVIDTTTDTSSSGQVFNNIRIASGTHPNFANRTTLNGIIYIEAGNDVTFDGQVTINGMIVTEEAPDGFGGRLHFAGGCEAYGVENLPDTEEFAAVKQHTGSFILAPSFEVSFAGNFGTVNGVVVADRLNFGGRAEGYILGSIVGLADLPSSVDGNVHIEVDRSNADSSPAGIVQPFALRTLAESYLEP